MSGEQFAMLTRYLRLIQVQRQDFNGRVITIRHDDLMAIAASSTSAPSRSRPTPRRAGPAVRQPV